MAGGKGGDVQSNPNIPGGSGGTGFSGVDGDPGTGNTGSGGGGGGAGGGAGGNSATAAGGAGGDAGNPNGQPGNSGTVPDPNTGTSTAGGASGGGGGANGANVASFSNGGFSGGDGGRGGSNNTTAFSGGGGGGGAGGYGAIVSGVGIAGPGLSTNSATIAGGEGGNGGTGGLSSSGGSGGDGGVGVLFTATSARLDNTGTISGGNGGTAGATNGSNPNNASAGLGGAGVIGQNLAIFNSGTISGGLKGDILPANAITSDYADALTFTSGTNSLTLSVNGVTGTLTGTISIGGSLTIDPGTTAGASVTLSNLLRDYTAPDGTVTRGALEKVGAGTLVLTGPIRDASGPIILTDPNTYTGGTTISGGKLVVNGGVDLGVIDSLGTGAVTFNGGALENGATRNLVLNNAVVVGSLGGTITTNGTSGLINFRGALTNTDNTAPGTITFAADVGLLANNSGFLGTSVLTNGATVFGSAVNALSPNSVFQVDAGATLNLLSGDQTIAALANGPGGNGGTVKSGFAVVDGVTERTVLTLGGGLSPSNLIDTSFSGVIADDRATLSLTLGSTFASTQTLTGANTYTGATTINGGTLRLGAGGTVGTLSATSAVTVGTNGTLAVNHSDILTLANIISGTGAFQQVGSGGTLLSGANGSFSGAVALNAGTLALNHTTTANNITTIDAAGTGTITFAAGAQTLRLDTAGTLAATIANFASDDTIDLQQINFPGAQISVNDTTVTVTETTGGNDVNQLTINAAPAGFQYTLVNDGAGFAALKLTAIPPAPPAPSGPTAVSDTASATFGKVLTATAPGVLANDSGAGGTIAVTAVNGQTANVGKAVLGTYGSLTLKGDGSYTYTPDATKTVFTTSVLDHFTYTDTANGQTATANLDITVSAPPVSTLALFGTVVTNSASQTGSVYALYEGLLGRAPDALGLEGFSASLQAGAKLTDVAAAILNSAERGGLVSDPNAYVQALYTNTLHRAPDSAGQQFYVNELNNGVSQATVAVQFASSTEAAQVNAQAFSTGVFVTDAIDAAVARLYYGVLGRTPDAGGLGSFEMQVKQAAASGGVNGAIQGLASVANAMLGSQEYGATHTSQSDAAFVDSLFIGALGRHADAGGSAFYVNELAQGASQAQVALQIAQSQEAQVHLVGQIELGWHII